MFIVAYCSFSEGKSMLQLAYESYMILKYNKNEDIILQT